MTLSTHATVAEAVRAELAVWAAAELPAGAVVARVHRVEQLRKFVDDEQAVLVAVIASANEVTTQDRATDLLEITVTVLILAALADLELATVDGWDYLAERCRQRIRTVQRVAVGSDYAVRRNTSVPTLYDADWLHEHELFCAVLESVYRVGSA